MVGAGGTGLFPATPQGLWGRGCGSRGLLCHGSCRDQAFLAILQELWGRGIGAGGTGLFPSHPQGLWGRGCGSRGGPGLFPDTPPGTLGKGTWELERPGSFPPTLKSFRGGEVGDGGTELFPNHALEALGRGRLELDALGSFIANPQGLCGGERSQLFPSVSPLPSRIHPCLQRQRGALAMCVQLKWPVPSPLASPPRGKLEQEAPCLDASQAWEGGRQRGGPPGPVCAGSGMGAGPESEEQLAPGASLQQPRSSWQGGEGGKGS